MSDENKVKAVADRLRGRGEQALTQAREAGKQLAGQGVKMQEAARQVSGPQPTPRGPTQSAGDPAERHRQILDKQRNGLVNSGRGVAPAPQGEPAKAVAEKQPAKEAAVAKDKTIAEAARSFREAGVSGGKAANDVGRAAQTPAVQQQNRGRSR